MVQVKDDYDHNLNLRIASAAGVENMTGNIGSFF